MVWSGFIGGVQEIQVRVVVLMNDVEHSAINEFAFFTYRLCCSSV